MATGVVATLSLIGGFLASARVLALDGSILIWVFPVMMACYGITRWRVAQQYGHELACDPGDSMALQWRLATGAAMVGFVAFFAYVKQDALLAGMLIGMAAVIVVVAFAKAIIRWRKRREGHTDGSA